MSSDPNPDKDVFLLGQPLFRLVEPNPDIHWRTVINEMEPRDDHRRDNNFVPAFRPPDAEKHAAENPAWERLDRAKLIETLSDPPDSWRRVMLVCGAGIGKTTTLQWLEAALNRHAECRGQQLAFFLELHEITDSASNLMKLLLKKMDNPGLEPDLERRRKEGRITLFLDSLDQAGPNPKGPSVTALKALMGSSWASCPIWVSGRPHAFQMNSALFRDKPWECVRIGQLEEPECRFFLETIRSPRTQRTSP